MKRIYEKPELNIYSISSLQANALSDVAPLQPGIGNDKDVEVEWEDLFN